MLVTTVALAKSHLQSNTSFSHLPVSPSAQYSSVIFSTGLKSIFQDVDHTFPYYDFSLFINPSPYFANIFKSVKPRSNLDRNAVSLVSSVHVPGEIQDVLSSWSCHQGVLTPSHQTVALNVY